MSRGAYRDAELQDLHKDFNEHRITEEDFVAGCNRLKFTIQRKHLTRELTIEAANQRCPACGKPICD